MDDNTTTSVRPLLDSARGIMDSKNSSYQSTENKRLHDNEEDVYDKENVVLPCPRRYAYGVGHVMNDLAASMWFTYFIVFYHYVLQISNAYAGLLVLIGQVADALTTPVVGYFCDHTNNGYGGRKTFHLIGTVMVALSLFFFWHRCIYCDQQPVPYQILYFSCFIIVFQSGWATVQVSHLALIPELTPDKNERVGLNSIRYAFTILSNVSVYIAMLTLLAVIHGSSSSTKISSDDMWLFSGMAIGIVIVGSVFAFIFHIGTREPSAKRQVNLTNTVVTCERNTLRPYQWFLKPHFYLVGVIYMSTRLVVNLIQVYAPLYVLDTLGLNILSVAIVPLVMYFSGLFTTFFLKILHKVIGRYVVYFIGLILVWCALIWFRFWPAVPVSVHNSIDNYTNLQGIINLHPLPHYEITENFIYGAAILIGIGGTTMLVTSLSMVADLIGKHSGSSAFVYGAMSFTDKLSNGIAIQIIQLLHPCKEKVCCSKCSEYYRNVVSLGPGAATLTALIALVAMLALLQYKKRKGGISTPICPDNENTNNSNRYSIQNTNCVDEKSPLINK